MRLLFPLASINSSLMLKEHKNSLITEGGPVEHVFKKCKHSFSLYPVFLNDLRFPSIKFDILNDTFPLKQK